MRMKSFALAAGFAAISVLGTAGAATADTAAKPELKLSAVPVVKEIGAKKRTCIQAEDGNGGVRGIGCFESNGDNVFAGDAAKDGLWVRTDWQTNYGRDGDCRDMNSKGDGNWCNFNMKGGKKVKFQVEVWDGKTRVAETGWTKWLAIGK